MDTIKAETNTNSIDTQWFITLSNKLDYYLEQNDNINKQINNINEELNNLKLIYIYNQNEFKLIKELLERNINTNNLIKIDINTINAKLNDNILNLSYIDDKIQEISQNVTLLTDQINQLQDNRNNFSSSPNIII